METALNWKILLTPTSSNFSNKYTSDSQSWSHSSGTGMGTRYFTSICVCSHMERQGGNSSEYELGICRNAARYGFIASPCKSQVKFKGRNSWSSKTNKCLNKNGLVQWKNRSYPSTTPRPQGWNMYNSRNPFFCPFYTDFDPGEQQDQHHPQQGPQPTHQAAASLPVQECTQGHAPQHAQEPAGAAHPRQWHQQDQEGHFPGHVQHHCHGYETTNIPKLMGLLVPIQSLNVETSVSVCVPFSFFHKA